jgi:putative salt-induced outer membrane protein YdiY
MPAQRHFSRLSILCGRFLICLASGLPIFAQTAGSPPPKNPDTLIFTNGDKLTGQLQRSKGGDVTFKSDMAGEFTVDWSKVKELHTTDHFAVIPKNVKVERGQTATVPQGTLTVTDQKIEVSKPQAGAPQTIPTSDAAYVIDQTTFQNAVLHEPGFLHAWTGAIAAGVSLVEATQSSNSFSGAINLVRVSPDVSWLDRRNRTIFDFNFAYGKLSEPGTPTIKTDIYYLDFERDEYLTRRLYGFGAFALDHNFSQGLDLQQTYGGGLGFTAISNEVQELDFKASLNYIRQQFTDSTLNQNLIGSTFSERYSHRLPASILFTQGVSYSPAWNNTSAYSGQAHAGISLPLYKHFGLTLNAIDTFLNNPPPGFKKNSFQFTTALSYTIQ